MPDLLTTDEAATYLRLSERKLYDLVANGAVPCTKVTGRWLFPKAALDRWRADADRVSHTDLVQSVLDESGYTAMWKSLMRSVNIVP